MNVKQSLEISITRELVRGLNGVDVKCPLGHLSSVYSVYRMKNYIKFVSSNKHDQIVIQFLSDTNDCKNDQIKDDTITYFITDSTKL